MIKLARERHVCTECFGVMIDGWSKVATCKTTARAADSYYHRIYELDLREYGEMYVKQIGRCAICHQLPSKKRLVVDHDHTTGKVRGLLCGQCNTGLGMFKDRAGNLDAAYRYLLRARGPKT